MKWYNYLACFFLGAFLINSVPHIIHGISGDSFPTPFANPPGKGLSSPLINLLWGYFNLLMSYILYKFSKLNSQNKQALASITAGIIIMSFVLGITLAGKLS
ncbi:hypothetical protein [Aureibacter tunicatorum]|nr:hypothetical protein [Aureibacter tunicatorum]BDD03853.1 hypothetical protein AUTU_13360 [Aureibacter tunicatorum]